MFAQTHSAALGKKHGKRPVRKLAPRFRACLLLAIAFAEALSSQVSAQNRPTSSKGPAAAVTALKGKDLVPEDATKAILAAFDRYEVVGMPAARTSNHPTLAIVFLASLLLGLTFVVFGRCCLARQGSGNAGVCSLKPNFARLARSSRLPLSSFRITTYKKPGGGVTYAYPSSLVWRCRFDLTLRERSHPMPWNRST
jgi:hypothetical protein